MPMTSGFKLCHTLFLVLVCQYCAKVGATKNVNGFFDGYDRGSDYDGSFGSGGVGVLTGKRIGTTLIIEMTNSPELAPSIAPVESEVPINASEEGLVFDFEKIKNIGSEVVSNDYVVNLKNVGRIDVSHSGINNRKIKDGIVSTFKWW